MQGRLDHNDNNSRSSPYDYPTNHTVRMHSYGVQKQLCVHVTQRRAVLFTLVCIAFTKCCYFLMLFLPWPPFLKSVPINGQPF